MRQGTKKSVRKMYTRKEKEKKNQTRTQGTAQHLVSSGWTNLLTLFVGSTTGTGKVT